MRKQWQTKMFWSFILKKEAGRFVEPQQIMNNSLAFHVFVCSIVHLELFTRGMESRGGMESIYEVYAEYVQYIQSGCLKQAKLSKIRFFGPLCGPKRVFWVVWDFLRQAFCIYCIYFIYIYIYIYIFRIDCISPLDSTTP